MSTFTKTWLKDGCQTQIPHFLPLSRVWKNISSLRPFLSLLFTKLTCWHYFLFKVCYTYIYEIIITIKWNSICFLGIFSMRWFIEVFQTLIYVPIKGAIVIREQHQCKKLIFQSNFWLFEFQTKRTITEVLRKA